MWIACLEAYQGTRLHWSTTWAQFPGVVLLMVQISGEKTTWDVFFFKNPVNNGISYQPQLVISSINSMTYRSISFEDSFLRCFCKVNPRRCQRKVRLLGMLDPLLNCNPPGHWYWENILRQTRGFGEPRSNRPRAVRSKKTSLPNRIFATCRARSTPLLPMLSSRGQARP